MIFKYKIPIVANNKIIRHGKKVTQSGRMKKCSQLLKSNTYILITCSRLLEKEMIFFCAKTRKIITYVCEQQSSGGKNVEANLGMGTF